MCDLSAPRTCRTVECRCVACGHVVLFEMDLRSSQAALVVCVCSCNGDRVTRVCVHAMSVTVYASVLSVCVSCFTADTTNEHVHQFQCHSSFQKVRSKKEKQIRCIDSCFTPVIFISVEDLTQCNRFHADTSERAQLISSRCPHFWVPFC